MKNILVPIGTSENSLSHLQYAIDFAQAFGARLYVVQVFNVFTKAGTMMKVDHILERGSQAILDELISKADKKNVEVITKVLKGDLVDTLELASKVAEVDLMIIQPKTTSMKKELFLGKTSGKIIKKTQIPTLIVPDNYRFKPVTRILMALKSAIIRKEDALNPVTAIQDKFKSIINLLLVKTPYYNDGDFEVQETLAERVTNITKSENATTFQGVLEHFQNNQPDMLCVVRRKRGFFMKKWEKNVILKRDFYCSIPVLVLRGMK